MTRLRWPALAVVALAFSACSGPPPPGTPGPSSSATVAPSPPASGIIADPISLRPPGQPFDAEDILDAMRVSPRPGGVPEVLQTQQIAADVAGVLWTLEGEAWETIVAGGSCASRECTLELAGSVPGGLGEDVWVLAIAPDGSDVEVVTADLHAVPAEAADALDRLARAADGDGALDDLLLTSVRWQPPPDANRFVLAYRSGDEEESCSMNVLLDVDTATVAEVDSSGC